MAIAAARVQHTICPAGLRRDGSWPCPRHSAPPASRGRVVVNLKGLSPPENTPSSIGGLQLLNAKQDLLLYCKTSPDAECYPTLEWFTQKCEDVQAALAIGGPGAATNEEYLRLLQALRELAYTSMDSTYASLKLMKRLEERRAAAGQLKAGAPHPNQAGQPHAVPTQTSAARSDLPPEAREYYLKVFEKADSNANGRLSWSEFHAALHWLGDDLTEDELELVSSALDLQGSVTLDEFMAIVEEAEETRSSPTSDARFLRHFTHKRPSRLDHLSARSITTNGY